MSSGNIRPVEASNRARAVSVQTLAFGADPVMRWLYPDSHDYLTHFPRFANFFGGRAFEHASAYATEDFGGVSMWLPVDTEPDGEAIVRLFRDTLPEAKLWGALGVLEQMGAYHIQEPHWYLAILGVDPAQQGRGIGSELLRHSLAPCDDQGMIAYLESSNPANVPLYQRHGFEVVGEIQAGASPPVFPMIRRPR